MPSKRSSRSLLPLLAIGIAALAACAQESAPPVSGGLSGEDLFEENCSACHGKGMGPPIEHLRSLSNEEIRAGIINHPTAGQIRERLQADRVDKLINFLDSEESSK
ncbi:MAG: cytochrome c [Gammaproteobacteria bacterium]|nr:cytochrome c [Gammaproteobacteria bacterium]